MKYPENKGTTKNPIQGKTLATKEKYILANFPLLKFEDWTRKKTMTLEAFKKSFWMLNDQYNTISPEDDDYECFRGSSRSIIDIYLLFKYYYRKITLKEVMAFTINSTTEEPGFICIDVKRKVYYALGAPNRQKDELGYDFDEFTKACSK